MSKNRKNQSAAIRFGPAVKALLLCLLIGGSGVGYVWQKTQIYELGRQMTRREHDLKVLQKKNEALKRTLGTMYSVTFLEERIKTLRLGLAPPQPSQVWRLKEHQLEESPAEIAAQYAAQRPQSANW